VSRRIPAIPEPSLEPTGLLDTIGATKQAVEIIGGADPKLREFAAVTWQDLVDLGLIEATQIPR
jgi:hypothetical protein